MLFNYFVEKYGIDKTFGRCDGNNSIQTILMAIESKVVFLPIRLCILLTYGSHFDNRSI